MKNSGGIIIGIVAAAATGVILGMLFSPKKGEEFRKSIAEGAGDWAKKIGDLITEGKNGLKTAKDSVADGAKDFRQKVEKV